MEHSEKEQALLKQIEGQKLAVDHLVGRLDLAKSILHGMQDELARLRCPLQVGSVIIARGGKRLKVELISRRRALASTGWRASCAIINKNGKVGKLKAIISNDTDYELENAE